MNKIRITAIRQTIYQDLMAQYENPIEHACTVQQGQQWISINGQRPDGMFTSQARASIQTYRKWPGTLPPIVVIQSPEREA